MSEPVITIKPVCNDQWQPLRTEVFIGYQGHRYHTRLAHYVADSAHQRAYFAQEFLRRQKIHPSTVKPKETCHECGNVVRTGSAGGLLPRADVSDAIQARVEQALNSDIVDFAKTGAPPVAKRPALSLVD